MTPSEFSEWKSFSVTKEVFAILKDRVEQLQYELGQSAGLDALDDRFKCGAIGAYNDVLQIEIEVETK